MKLKALMVAALALICSVATAQAEYRAVTATNLTPYSRGADLDMPGFNHELLEEIVKRSGVDIKIEYLPWKRAQKVAQTEPNTLIFGITRNAKREPLYKWVTHMLTNSTVFLTTGDPVNSIDEAEGLGRVGAFANRFRTLAEKGWSNVEEGDDHSNFQKLSKGRLDAVWTLSSRAIFTWTQELGLPADQLIIGDSTGTAELWLAAHPDFPDDVSAQIAAAYKEIREDEFYDALYKKYFGDLPIM